MEKGRKEKIPEVLESVGKLQSKTKINTFSEPYY